MWDMMQSCWELLTGVSYDGLTQASYWSQRAFQPLLAVTDT